MRQYTPDDYKRMIDEYCAIKSDASIALSKPSVINSDIFNMTRNELIDFIVNDICHKSKSIKNMLNQKDKIVLFFDWCVENGYIFHNVLREEEFDDAYFIYKSIESIDVTVFYDEVVEYLIAKITSEGLNVSLYELLIRGAYEGIRSIRDFIRLKYSDIDHANKTIITSGKKRVMSDEFFTALTSYRNCHVYEKYDREGNPKAQTKLKQYEDYIFKYYDLEGFEIQDADSYVKYIAINITRYFAKISELAGYTITYDMLYVSGFVNYVKSVYDHEGKTLTDFNNLFLYGNSMLKSGAYTRILDLAKEYGLAKKSTTASEVRRLCLPYIVKGKYYQI